MAFAEVIKPGRQNEYVKPVGMAVNISKAYLELSEPLKDGETVTLRMTFVVPLLGPGVICARFSNKKDGVTLNLTLPSDEKCGFYFDGPPSARVHLTGSILEEPKEPVPVPIEPRPRRCEI